MTFAATRSAARVEGADPSASRAAGALVPFVLVSFAANSLITRYVVAHDLLDPFLLSAVRFIAGAAALLAIALARRERPSVRRADLLPALWLGGYAVCISFGYRYIGAAAGTFVFYATVLLTLVAHDRAGGVAVPTHRAVGALVALSGVAALSVQALGTVTIVGVLLLAVTGAAWGMYTAAGRGGRDPRAASTSNFTLLAAILLVPTGAELATGAQLTTTGLAWAVGMGAVTTALAYVAWYACQRSMSATTAGTVQLAIPVLTTAGAVVLLGEPLTPAFVVAALLVATGLTIASRGGRPHVPRRRQPS